MTHQPQACRAAMNRRAFLVASGVGYAGLQFGGLGLAAPAAESGEAARTVTGPGRAKSTILFFLCGGASHLDTWDMKPAAPREYRGPFQPIATSAPGIQLSEHLPMLARQAHHLALVNSVAGTVNTNDHHAGYYHNLTGHVPDVTFRVLGNNRTPFPSDWPYMGSVIASKRPRHPHLPNLITLPHMPSRAPYTRPGQFAARLGLEHDPFFVQGSFEKPLEFQAPALELYGDVLADRLASRHELLRTVNGARREFDRFARVQRWTRQQDRAISLLMSARTTQAFDLMQEPQQVRRRYGETVNGMSLLLARRLVEAEVPFITVFWLGHGIGSALAKKCKSAGSWDTHGNNFGCLKDSLLPEFDRCYSALIEDLHRRGMLDETLLLVTSEMGRTPKIGDPRSGGTSGQGRDHWTHCLTDVLAGGGIRGGQTYGRSDRLGEYPADLRVTPADVTRTVYDAMGINDLTAKDKDGRTYNLLDDGKPIVELF
ncbi:MAG: DUF1501 domain-containing protein [Pirellulaceae bacterium]|nr:DUF1501 domain-containing protein [Pirellulaceae bacterium]MDP6554809.1 DUF1501 domain-containing protein [Pirellulaceae bacterium]